MDSNYSILLLENTKKRLNILKAELLLMIDEKNNFANDCAKADSNLINKGLLNLEFVNMENEIKNKQDQIERVKRVVMSYEYDLYREFWDNGELVLWDHKGLHYFRNNKNHVYSQNPIKWIGVYVEAEDMIDMDAEEPDEMPPLVSTIYLDWSCDKTTDCLCNK